MESHHIEHTGRSRSKSNSHVSCDQETLRLQQEVDRLHKKLRRRKHDRRSPSSPSSEGSKGSRDRLYRCRSRTPPSESYSASLQQDELEEGNNKRGKGPSHRTMGNDAMSKALWQISKSPFVRRINKARLPHQFFQPTFTIYNGRTDIMEHVSHFNQKMAIHVSNEAFMYTPPVLGLSLCTGLMG